MCAGRLRLAEDEYAREAGPWKGVSEPVDDRRAGATKRRPEGRGDFFRPELSEICALREIDRIERGRHIRIHPP